MIYNLAYILNDNNKLVRTFDQYKVMEIFAQSLKEASDDAVIIDILKTLSGLFALGEKKKEEFGVNPFKSYFDQSNGREVLQSIETKQEDILVLLAELENYYDTEEWSFILLCICQFFLFHSSIYLFYSYLPYHSLIPTYSPIPLMNDQNLLKIKYLPIQTPIPHLKLIANF